jgi:ribosome-associated protein
MLRVTRDIAIDENEITERFVHASGPGGQHVNKAATAVQLTFDVVGSPSLSEEVRERLADLAASERRTSGRMTDEGVLIIEASRFRSQRRNRRDARRRLIKLIRQAAKPPKVRRETKPPRTARERRLRNKRRRSEKKRLRRKPREDW